MSPKDADNQGASQATEPAVAPKAVKTPRKAPAKSNNVTTQNKKAAKIPVLDKQTVKSSGKQAEKTQGGRKMGRPKGSGCTYTEDIARKICDLLSEGITLREICRMDGMPAWRTVYDWKDERPDFNARFARARDKGFDAIAEDTIQILDEVPERTATEFGTKVDPGYVAWQKNRVEQRMKLLAKWSPGRFGEKVDVNHGGQPGNPVQAVTRVVMVPAKESAVVEQRALNKEGDD